MERWRQTRLRASSLPHTMVRNVDGASAGGVPGSNDALGSGGSNAHMERIRAISRIAAHFSQGQLTCRAVARIAFPGGQRRSAARIGADLVNSSGIADV